MAKTWSSVTVELLGGGGYDLWPWPGRVFAVGPSHTFAQLAEAIDVAFARWDRAHLSMFTLADGRVVTDSELGGELASSPEGPLAEPLDIGTATVAQTVGRGEEFQYTFDLGDGWVHRCVVGDATIDPREVLGTRPSAPSPFWGWGSIPDQYGRRWADDDGEQPTPPRPAAPHPMQRHAWPSRERLRELDLDALHRATLTGELGAVLEVITGAETGEALQQVGAALVPVLTQDRERSGPVVASLHDRLTLRDARGDRELAEDLLALLREEPPAGRVVPVDLDVVVGLLDTDPVMSSAGYLDLVTGETIPGELTDPTEVGEEYAVDVDADPERWLRIEPAGSRDGWQDMADFADRQETGLRETLLRAIDGRGAFRRFRDAVADEGLLPQWRTFSTDRRWGRARELLAVEGFRVGGAPAEGEPTAS